MVAKTASWKKRIPKKVDALGKLRVGAHQERECFAVSELVVAPLLEPF